MTDDFSLLDDYLATSNQAAFRALVDLHLPLIYNFARRQFSGHETHAEDIVQSVFILLARKARENKFPRNMPLAAWLYQTTRYCCSNLKRLETRRKRRELIAGSRRSIITSTQTPDFDLLETLAAALARLSERDRDLLLIRFSISDAQHPIVQAAAAMGIPRDTAEKRISRALEKLRASFIQAGVAMSGVTIPDLLARQTHPIPPHLPAAVTGATHPSARTLTLMASMTRTAAPSFKAAAILMTLSASLMGLSWHYGSLAMAAVPPAPPATASALPDADPLPALIPGPLPQRTYFADRSRNVFPNGDFSTLKDSKLPPGWSASPDPFALSIATADPKWEIIHLISIQPGKKIELHSTLPLKPEWTTLAVRATIGIANPQLGNSGNAAAGVICTFLDKDGRQIDFGVLLDAVVSNPGFLKVRMATMHVPPTAAALQLSIRFSDATGKLNVGRITVMPVDPTRDPDPNQVMAVHNAVTKGDVEKLTALISADKRLLESRNMQWDCGPPLLGAAWLGQTEVVKALLELGADPKSHDDNGPGIGWSATTDAAWWGRPECLKLMMEVTPEDPKEIYKTVVAGRARHHPNVPDADYQACLDYLTQKFSNAATQAP